MNPDSRALLGTAIKKRLNEVFAGPSSSCEVEDDSARHAGHPGAREGAHFNVCIISSAFTGHSKIHRHRLVYEALADYLKNGQIHALSIKARTPEEESLAA